MLVAEEVAALAGKKLDFGDWEGEDTDRSWARSLRSLIKERDIDAGDTQTLFEEEQESTIRETSDSAKPIFSGPASPKNAIRAGNAPEPDSDDDFLQGYASEENSDRAPSPTPSELEEIERDPTLNVGAKKVPKPIYLTQLGELVRSTGAGLKSAENDEPDKIEMALNCGEELIRRKRNFGLELGRWFIQRRDSTHTECNRGERREPRVRVHRTTKFVRFGRILSEATRDSHSVSCVLSSKVCTVCTPRRVNRNARSRRASTAVSSKSSSRTSIPSTRGSSC